MERQETNGSFEAAIHATAYVVGICGGTASGKSSIVETIVKALHPIEISIIDQDSFYKDFSHLTAEERANINFDHPDAIDSGEFHHTLTSLKNGLPATKPRYDFVTHSRLPHKQELHPARILIVEGLHVLHFESIRNLLDHRIFIDVDSDIRFIRRLVRDIEERGRTMQCVIDQYLTTVRPMDKVFVQPLREFADVVFTQDRMDDQVNALVSMLRGLCR